MRSHDNFASSAYLVAAMTPSNISRRQFLEASVAVAASAALGAAPATTPSNEKPVRIGVVGVGDRGIGLIDTLLALPGVQINAVCDVRQDRAALGQKKVEDQTGKRPEAYIKSERDWENL